MIKNTSQHLRIICVTIRECILVRAHTHACARCVNIKSTQPMLLVMICSICPDNLNRIRLEVKTAGQHARLHACTRCVNIKSVVMCSMFTANVKRIRPYICELITMRDLAYVRSHACAICVNMISM
jgi:hypothetical protein